MHITLMNLVLVTGAQMRTWQTQKAVFISDTTMVLLTDDPVALLQTAPKGCARASWPDEIALWQGHWDKLAAYAAVANVH